MPTPLRIAFLDPSAQVGGAEAALLDLMISLRAAEPEWKLFLVLTEQGPLAERAAAAGVEVRVVSLPQAIAAIGDAGAGGPAGTRIGRAGLAGSLARGAFALPRYLRALRAALREIRPDVIHTNGFKMHLLGLWSRPGAVPVVWHVHDYASRRPVMARALRRYRKDAAAAITNSRSVAEDLRAVCGAGLEIVPILNAIDVDRFTPEGPALDLDAVSGLAPAAVRRVGMVSTMARWKGQEVFLRALALLSDMPDVRGYVIGGTVYRTRGSEYSIDELKAAARELGLEGRVGFTGLVPDAAEAFRALDVVVHASTEPEPFGLVILEALACGRPVAVSAAGGAAEVLGLVEGARGYPPGDAEALAGLIRQLLDDPGAARRRGRPSVIANFSRRRLGPEAAAVYRRVAG